MTRVELRQRVEEYLQDKENRRWSDSEINRYLDDAQREFVRLVKWPQVKAEVNLNSGSSSTATLSVDGKTATLTMSSAHGLSTGDSVYISGASPDEYNGTYIMRKVSDTAVSFAVAVGEAVTDSAVDWVQIGPEFTKPSTIQEVVQASIDGVDLLLLTEGEINSAVFDGTNTGSMLQGVFGMIPNPFTTVQTRTVGNEYTPKWEERTGAVQALVFNNRTSPKFRIFPIPEKDYHLYVDKDATSKVFKPISIRGVQKVEPMATDASEPIIDEYWQEALIWGTLERAYLKESQSRDVEKSNYYRQKFMGLMSQALASEGLSAASHYEGRNESSFRIVR